MLKPKYEQEIIILEEYPLNPPIQKVEEDSTYIPDAIDNINESIIKEIN